MTANNLHRELAPISSAAWAEIEQEASRTFKRNIAGRRVVDMPDPKGIEFSALTTGHLTDSTSAVNGVDAALRDSIPVVELTVPFTVARKAVDDVLRGSVDSDWQPVKDAVTALAMAEDRVVFHGSKDYRMTGIVDGSSNAQIAVPENVANFPDAVSTALETLRLVGVQGPYTLVLSAELWTQVNETTDVGYPVLHHIERVLKDGNIVWAPAIDGAVVLSQRGGDYELHLGQDVSIGYDSHDADTVRLYFRESFAFRVATAEASVAIGS